MGMSYGSIVRVCDGKVSLVLEHKQQQAFETEAFFGIASGRDGVWTVSKSTLYRLTPPGSVTTYPLPDFMQVGGIALSRAIPGVIVLRTDMNMGHSLSGETPLIAPLD